MGGSLIVTTILRITAYKREIPKVFDPIEFVRVCICACMCIHIFKEMLEEAYFSQIPESK